MPKLQNLIICAALLVSLAPSVRAQCTSQQGFITVTLLTVDPGLYTYQWSITNDENGNGNRLTNVFFEIDTADTVSSSGSIASWSKAIESVEGTWNGLRFTHASGPAICSGGGSCSQNTETFTYTLTQLVSSVRVRTVQANGQTLDFTNFSSSQPGCAFLPIELASFDAVVDGSSILLNWATASEENAAGFEIEYRRTAAFETIGFVAASGSSEGLQEYSFIHAITGPAIGTYRLKMVDLDGTFEYSPEVEVEATLPSSLFLSAAYPNPFNPETRLELAVDKSQWVSVKVFDMTGREVATIFDGAVASGSVTPVSFTGAGLPSGVYFVRAAGDSFSASRTITMLK